MFAALPLLRSPPFPGIAPVVAAVSHRLATRRAPMAEQASLGAIMRLLAEAQVGGTFWAPPAALDDARTIVCVEEPRVAEARVEEAERTGATGPIAVLLPAGGEATAKRLRARGLRVLVGDVDPWSWARPGVAVHARASDERAFVALMAGASVVVPAVGRDQMYGLLAGRLFTAVAYRDPFEDRAATLETTVALLAEWRRQIDRNRGVAVTIGMARWKRRRIDAFLWDGTPRRVAHARSARAAIRLATARGGAVAYWPSRMPPDLVGTAAAAGIGLVQVEDGFVRSRGLGAELIPPWSVVVDPVGVHYDPASPSELEQILTTAEFTPAELARAEALIALLVRERIGKYGVERVPAAPLQRPARRLVLVAGQVEDDSSFRLGASELGGNLGLLRAARAHEPDAVLWYRPHPDVEAGHRRGAIADAIALGVADRVVRREDLATLLDTVDGVHVATSLTGFEALLRGRDAITHGLPFYAGWGLTRDLATASARRGRKRTLAELVAATLIRYPRYLDPRTGLPCSPEVLLDRLVNDPVSATGIVSRLRRWQGRARRFLAAHAS